MVIVAIVVTMLLMGMVAWLYQARKTKRLEQLSSEQAAVVGPENFGIAGIVEESHMEGDVRVIDKMQVTSVSIVGNPRSMR
jgi:hypothetical protein